MNIYFKEYDGEDWQIMSYEYQCEKCGHDEYYVTDENYNSEWIDGTFFETYEIECRKCGHKENITDYGLEFQT